MPNPDSAGSEFGKRTYFFPIFFLLHFFHIFFLYFSFLIFFLSFFFLLFFFFFFFFHFFCIIFNFYFSSFFFFLFFSLIFHFFFLFFFLFFIFYYFFLSFGVRRKEPVFLRTFQTRVRPSPFSEPAEPRFGPVLSPNSEPARVQSLEKGTGLSPNLPNQGYTRSFSKFRTC